MISTNDAFAKNNKMAKQKFRPTRPGGFSGAKAYIWYVEVLKKRRNAVGRTFCDAIKLWVRIKVYYPFLCLSKPLMCLSQRTSAAVFNHSTEKTLFTLCSGSDRFEGSDRNWHVDIPTSYL